MLKSIFKIYETTRAFGNLGTTYVLLRFGRYFFNALLFFLSNEDGVRVRKTAFDQISRIGSEQIDSVLRQVV